MQKLKINKIIDYLLNINYKMLNLNKIEICIYKTFTLSYLHAFFFLFNNSSRVMFKADCIGMFTLNTMISCRLRNQRQCCKFLIRLKHAQQYVVAGWLLRSNI